MAKPFPTTGTFPSEGFCLKKQFITIHELLEDKTCEFQFTLLTKKKSGLENQIEKSKVGKITLSSSTSYDKIDKDAIGLLDKKTFDYIFSFDKAKQNNILNKLCELPIPCFLITEKIENLGKIIDIFDHKKKPLIMSRLSFTVLKKEMTSYLKMRLKKEIYIHGSLLNVFGLGILVMGRSGIGKSECALSLINRGHQLIADDIVLISLSKQGSLIGAAHPLIRHHMEIRNLGIINILQLFGEKAVGGEKNIDLVVLLEKSSDNNRYDHLGIEQEYINFLGISVPLVRLTIAQSRNIAIILETAARKKLLNNKGIYPAKNLEKKIINKLEKYQVCISAKIN